MKKLLFTLLCMGMLSAASAQWHRAYGGYYSPRYYYPGYGLGLYGIWGYPYAPYPYYNSYYRPGKLEMQLEDIRQDYRDKIWSARQDKSLKGKARRAKIRELKKERDNELNQTIRNYYKH